MRSFCKFFFLHKKTKLIIGGALLFVSGYYAVTQQTTPDAGRPSDAERASDVERAFKLSEPGFVPDSDLVEPLRVDRTTWEVIGAEARRSENARLNTRDQKSARKNAALSIEDPVEFRKRFPKSDEEQLQEQDHRDAMTDPREYEPIIQAQKTPEQLQDEAWSQDTIVNPLKYQDTGPQPNEDGTTP
jgi:hypothetical protein